MYTIVTSIEHFQPIARATRRKKVVSLGDVFRTTVLVSPLWNCKLFVFFTEKIILQIESGSSVFSVICLTKLCLAARNTRYYDKENDIDFPQRPLSCFFSSQFSKPVVVLRSTHAAKLLMTSESRRFIWFLVWNSWRSFSFDLRVGATLLHDSSLWT